MRSTLLFSVLVCEMAHASLPRCRGGSSGPLARKAAPMRLRGGGIPVEDLLRLGEGEHTNATVAEANMMLWESCERGHLDGMNIQVPRRPCPNIFVILPCSSRLKPSAQIRCLSVRFKLGLRSTHGVRGVGLRCTMLHDTATTTSYAGNIRPPCPTVRLDARLERQAADAGIPLGLRYECRLLDLGANIDPRTRVHFTPLHHAAMRGHTAAAMR